ncbi:MAG: TlpA family protein disulfide reductase [Deltaproteobacteria bacterium]|nr:MAG: TlpA family protein disulfide reductase [Deltaproteobacteria bacterium]
MNAAKVRYWVKEIVIMAAVFGAVMFVMRTIRVEGQRGGGGDLPVGQPAPGFHLTDVATGAPVALSDLKGKPVILAFWGTYCPACREELGALEQIHREAAGRYALVTLSSEDPRKVRAFTQARGLSFQAVVDGSGATFDAYRVQSIPKTVIIDANGAIVHDFVGEADEDILREHMAKLTGG